MYMKKTNSKTMNIYENNEGDSKPMPNPFDSFKSTIKRNVKNMKKDQDSSQTYQSNMENESAQNQEEIAAMAKYHWTEDVPSYLYHEDVRKADVFYNVL
tara:strand:- start:63 stop:359 length:297 start_codon:yes stop_codon:yes gene_type:complete